MNPAQFREMQEAIRGESLDGWLFCNFRHRDPLADEILGLDSGSVASRSWFYAVPAAGEALGIVHAIEQNILESGASVSADTMPDEGRGAPLPGRRITYRGKDELLAALAPLAGKRWGCHFSPAITAISFLDAGTAALLAEAGLVLVPAAGLIQRFKGLLAPAEMEAHEQAARHLYEIVELAWERVRRSFSEKTPLYEGDIQRLMLDEFEKRNLICDHPPLVAAGINSANPHYDVAHNGSLFCENDVIQFDLWAKDPPPGGVYADISWLGVYAGTPSAEAELAFSRLLEAREGAYRFIGDELAAGRRPSGADVDRRARAILIAVGYTDAIRHRTGHGIDSAVHGSGVNMDSFEFPDDRLLLDGSCFSLEPGIYFGRFGMRTEINVYIKDGRPVISGELSRKGRQFELLRCS